MYTDFQLQHHHIDKQRDICPCMVRIKAKDFALHSTLLCAADIFCLHCPGDFITDLLDLKLSKLDEVLLWCVYWLPICNAHLHDILSLEV